MIKFPTKNSPIKTFSLAIMLAALFLLPVANPRAYGAKSKPGECVGLGHVIGLSDYQTYRVKMTTQVVVPTKGPNTTEIRVWHALPTYKPWCRSKLPYGSISLVTYPTAKIEPETDQRSTHAFWSTSRNLRPGAKTQYISDFQVISARRSLDPYQLKFSWQEVKDKCKTGFKLKKPCAEAQTLSNELKGNLDPGETMINFAKWIKENIQYNAKTSFDGADVSQTINAKTGHCSHIMNLFIQLCAAQGIPCRPVLGMNLSSPNAVPPTPTDRADFVNAHIWVEAYLPNLGWVEIEPAAGENCFTIPASYVQNNTAFQNYAVWVTEQGQASRMPEWKYNGSQMVNEYGISHTISFSK